MTHRDRLILLNLIPEVGSIRLRRLQDAFGDLERLWQATPQQVQQVEGIGPALAQRIVDGCRAHRRLEQELERVRRNHGRIVTLADPDYPELLRAIHDPPLALYLKGSLHPEDRIAVGIVGSRHASPYGLQCAERLGYDLALRGVTVVSGLARGIDAAAHTGAVKARGRTIAVLGSGVDRLYPPEHASLAAQITACGAVISEHPMGAAPWPSHFPQRNRIISGLSLGVVVVEAAQRSGALITADFALEQGREVFAVPGPVTSASSHGTHGLLKQGAKLVTSVDDILEDLRLIPVPTAASQAISAEGDLTPQPVRAMVSHEPQGSVDVPRESARRLLACLDAREPMAIDQLVAHSELEIAEVSALLLQLELQRRVRQLPGKRFVRI